MLDYEWGNPSSIMLTGNEVSGSETSRQMFEHNNGTVLSNNNLHGPTPTTTNGFSLHNHFNPPPQHYPFFDSRAFQGASTTPLVNQSPSMLSLNPSPALAHGPSHGLMFLLMSKSKHLTMAMNLNSDYKQRLEHEPKLDLNFKGQTYFPSSSNEDSRVYHFKMVDSSNLPRCQVEGCRADLSEAKHYHRRHKVCEFHSKAATVIAAGLTQRFCQQCSRFHLLSEFDNGKRSCRKRLADHNRRRRKTQQQAAQEIHKDNVASSSPECGAQSSQSLKVAVSWK